MNFSVTDRPQGIIPVVEANDYWRSLLDQMLSIPSNKAICLTVRELPLDHKSVLSPGGYWVLIYSRLARCLNARRLFRKGMIGHAWNPTRTELSVWINT